MLGDRQKRSGFENPMGFSKKSRSISYVHSDMQTDGTIKQRIGVG
jgi:hypothetical protein